MKAVHRYATLIEHVVQGVLPYARYVAAAERRVKEGVSEADVARRVREWTPTVLNPLNLMLRGLCIPRNLAAAINLFNKSGILAVRSNVEADVKSSGDFDWRVRREYIHPVIGPSICDSAVITSYDQLFSPMRYLQGRRRQSLPDLTSVGRVLGTQQSCIYQVTEILENRGDLSVAELSKYLGCHPRTLERRLSEEGTSATKIKQAVRLIKTVDLLRGTLPLDVVAVQCGFSDLPHMSRSLSVSCGLSPSVLRKAAHGLVDKEEFPKS